MEETFKFTFEDEKHLRVECSNDNGGNGIDIGGGDDDGGVYTSFNVELAGTLPTLVSQYLSENQGVIITALKLKGYLNGTDIKYIRELSIEDKYLSRLDISEANIVEGGSAYCHGDNFEDWDIDYNTETNEVSNYMFYKCKSLIYVSLPTSVTSIGGSAFWGCTGLTSITIPNSVTRIEDFAFIGVPADCVIHVPSGCKEKYATAGEWKYFKTIVDDL